MRKPFVAMLVPVYLALIFGLPVAILAGLFSLCDGVLSRGVVAIGSPFLVTISFIAAAGLLSRLHQHAIIPGKFPRDISHPIYGHRRLYGLCWTSVYYCSPVYFLCLSIPPLKTMLFRFFGYAGNLDFTVYPDTWIRDLPLLTLGKGAYLSNKSTIGTNLVLSNGYLLVDRITIGEGAVVGHLAMVAAGTEIGPLAEVGVGAAIGIKTSIGAGAKIGPTCAIEHGVVIGRGTAIGASTYVGTRSHLGENLRVPAGAVILPKSVVQNNGDLARTLQGRTKLMVNATHRSVERQWQK